MRTGQVTSLVIVTGCGQEDVLHPMAVIKPPAVPWLMMGSLEMS
jgi:hypothetical protein